MKQVIIFLMLSISSLSYSLDPDVISSCYHDSISKNHVDLVQDWTKNNSQSTKLETRMFVALCELSLGNEKKALNNINYVIEQDEYYPMALHTKAKILVSRNMLSEAEITLRRSIILYAGGIDDFFLLFDILEKRGRVINIEPLLRYRLEVLKAVNHINKHASSRIYYEEVELYRMLSEVLRIRGKEEEAANILSEGLGRSNASIKLFESLISVLKELNKNDDVGDVMAEYCTQANISPSKYCENNL